MLIISQKYIVFKLKLKCIPKFQKVSKIWKGKILAQNNAFLVSLSSDCCKYHILLSKYGRRISEFFNWTWQYIGKKNVEDSVETFVYYVRNGLGISQHFSKGYYLGRRTHYSILEKPSTQNIAACENQRKQCKFIDHWKSIKAFLKIKKQTKKNRMMQERQKDWLRSIFQQKSLHPIKSDISLKEKKVMWLNQSTTCLFYKQHFFHLSLSVA